MSKICKKTIGTILLELYTVVLLAVWPVSVSYRYWPGGIFVGIFSWWELFTIWREPPLLDVFKTVNFGMAWGAQAGAEKVRRTRGTS
jgi:hypothetical protein